MGWRAAVFGLGEEAPQDMPVRVRGPPFRRESPTRIKGRVSPCPREEVPMIPATLRPPPRGRTRSREHAVEQERESRADVRWLVLENLLSRYVLWFVVALALAPLLAIVPIVFGEPVSVGPLVLDLLVAAWAGLELLEKRWEANPAGSG
jgi:hypothetical protein